MSELLQFCSVIRVKMWYDMIVKEEIRNSQGDYI